MRGFGRENLSVAKMPQEQRKRSCLVALDGVLSHEDVTLFNEVYDY